MGLRSSRRCLARMASLGYTALERVTKCPSAAAGCEHRRLRLRAKMCLSVPQRARLQRLFTLHPSRLRSRLSLATTLILLRALNDSLRTPENPRPWEFPGSLQASSRADRRAITRCSRHLPACGRHLSDRDPSDSTS